MRTVLTDKQRQILVFIRDHLLAHGRPPTHRQIMAAFVITSPDGVVAHIDALERKGYVERGRHGTADLRLKGARLELAYTPDEAGFRLAQALGGVASLAEEPA